MKCEIKSIILGAIGSLLAWVIVIFVVGAFYKP